MNKQAMKEQVLAILQRDPKIGRVTPQSNLLTDYGLSSLDIADLVCAIEDELDIEIPEKVLVHMKTVGDIYDFVDGL